VLYVPVLKCKQGEKDALFALRDEIKENICPMLEITPEIIEKDNFNGTQEFWNQRHFFDVSAEYSADLNDDKFFHLLNKCDRELVVPTIRLSDNEEKVTKLIAESTNGVALRLFLEEILDDDFEENFIELQKSLAMSETDLIISVQYVDPNKVNETSFVVKGAINLITNIEEFRNIIFSSNSFPNTLDVEKHKLNLIPRNESKIFEKVKPEFSKKGIEVIYSDYGINHWSYFKFIPGMQPSFNIRYTNEDVYIIYKGDTVKKGGLNIDKVIKGCKLLVESPYFTGKDYSWGDNEIFEKAISESNKPGSLTTWRAISTNHHITFMVNLLSNRS
jgi:Beta protein